MGDGFGLFIYFEKFEDIHFENGITKRPNSKPRGPRKKTILIMEDLIMRKLIGCVLNFDTVCVELKFSDGSMIALLICCSIIAHCHACAMAAVPQDHLIAVQARNRPFPRL